MKQILDNAAIIANAVDLIKAVTEEAMDKISGLTDMEGINDHSKLTTEEVVKLVVDELKGEKHDQ